MHSFSLHLSCVRFDLAIFVCFSDLIKQTCDGDPDVLLINDDDHDDYVSLNQMVVIPCIYHTKNGAKLPLV